MIIEVDYSFFLVSAHIGTGLVDVSQLMTIDTQASYLLWILLVIGSTSVVSGSSGCIRRWEVHWYALRWMVGLDGVCPGRLVASVSGVIRFSQLDTSAKNIYVRAEWLRQSGRAPSEPSETPWWRMTPRLASIPRVVLHIALRSPFRHYFSLCRSPISNKHSGVVANCDHTSE